MFIEGQVDTSINFFIQKFNELGGVNMLRKLIFGCFSLVVLFNCSTMIRNLDESSLQNINRSEGKGLLLVTVKKDYGDIMSNRASYSVQDLNKKNYEITMSLGFGKFEKNIYIFEMPSGEYKVTSIGVSSFRNQTGSAGLRIPFAIQNGAVTYLHNIVYDIALAGFGRTTYAIHDKFDEDVNIVKQKYPKLSSLQFINSKGN